MDNLIRTRSRGANVLHTPAGGGQAGTAREASQASVAAADSIEQPADEPWFVRQLGGLLSGGHSPPQPAQAGVGQPARASFEAEAAHAEPESGDADSGQAEDADAGSHREGHGLSSEEEVVEGPNGEGPEVELRENVDGGSIEEVGHSISGTQVAAHYRGAHDAGHELDGRRVGDEGRGGVAQDEGGADFVFGIPPCTDAGDAAITDIGRLRG